MKKKLAMIVMTALMTGMLSACGNGNADANTETNADTQAAEVSLEELDVDKYVTLGEYMGLEATVAPMNVVDDATVEESAYDVYIQYVTAENGGVKDRAVANGDIVNIDYEGKKDGVPFEGGTAANQQLTIGSGQFIPGFEEGLVDVMPGETVDIDLTFPEQYHSADMAGQAVTFTVTVNFIYPDKMEEDVYAAFGLEDMKTLDDFRNAAREALNEQAQQLYNNSVSDAVLNAFMNNCEFKDVPQEMVDKYAQIIRMSVTQQGMQYGMTAEQFAQAAYYMDLETLVKEYSMAGVKQDIALQAVANKESLNVDKEELDTLLQEAATAAEYESVEAFLEKSGTTPEDYRDYIVTDRTMNFLIENAVVTETK